MGITSLRTVQQARMCSQSPVRALPVAFCAVVALLLVAPVNLGAAGAGSGPGGGSPGQRHVQGPRISWALDSRNVGSWQHSFLWRICAWCEKHRQSRHSAGLCSGFWGMLQWWHGEATREACSVAGSVTVAGGVRRQLQQASLLEVTKDPSKLTATFK